MYLSFLIGLAVCAILITFGIAFDSESCSFVFGNLLHFIHLPGLLLTIGGTFAALFGSFPREDFVKMRRHIPIWMGTQKWDPMYYIKIMNDLCQEARKRGLLALEERSAELEDPFLRDSVMLIFGAAEPDKVRAQLDSELSNIEARHASAWNLYDKGAALAPGFGLLGTIIGVCNMLRAMSFAEEGGASLLAQGMAIALSSTFYGFILANALFIPLGNQLRAVHEKEMLCKEIIVEGLLSIKLGESPRHTNEKLMSYLTRIQRGRYAALHETSG